MTETYPLWRFFPSRLRPPDWVPSVTAAFSSVRAGIDSIAGPAGLTSDSVLALLRPPLVAIGFEIESGKRKDQKIRRPVLFEDQGTEEQAYEVDGFHSQYGIALEVEAGWGARGNAVYRDLIEASLLVDARFLVLAVMQGYRHKSAGRDVMVQSYADARALLNAIYASSRLLFPLEGILLVGY